MSSVASLGTGRGTWTSPYRSSMSVGFIFSMRRKRSKILDAVHETSRGLHAGGAIDQVTMREFDRLCLKPVPPLRPAEIKRIRESANVSQAVFAAILNTRRVERGRSSTRAARGLRKSESSDVTSDGASHRASEDRVPSKPKHAILSKVSSSEQSSATHHPPLQSQRTPPHPALASHRECDGRDPAAATLRRPPCHPAAAGGRAWC